MTMTTTTPFTSSRHRIGGILLLLLLSLPRSMSLTREEVIERNRADAEAYNERMVRGVDEAVSHTAEAARLRNYQLRKKKRKGLLHKRQTTLAQVLFPGVTPETYQDGEDVFMMTELVQSKKTTVPFEFYDDLEICDMPAMSDFRQRHKTQRKNLGARLQGVELKPAPYVLKVKENIKCKTVCKRTINNRKLRWLRKLVDRQYRIHMTLDSLPVLVRSAQMNFAVRGYPVGFRAPPSHSGLEEEELFLYNHLKFTITYEADKSGEGVYITGFDATPVSIQHASDGSTCDELPEDSSGPVNNPKTYLPLRVGTTGENLEVMFTYEVEWVESQLPWADRWDVYLIGSADDDIHFFAIVNSLMIVLFLAGTIAIIMIRTIKKDIMTYNEMIEDGTEETGWKLVHGDVFRPPSNGSIALAVLVGNGAQIGTAFFITLMSSIARLLNPIKKGHMLTAVIVLYVLSGSVAGYVSSRIFKFCGLKAWRLNTILTAVAIPGMLVGIFTILNVFLSIAGAANAVSFLMLLFIFALWVCVSAPLVFVGAFFGLRADKIEVPTKINQIARMIPPLPWYNKPPFTFLIGGILPFGSVCIELFFIMSALWLHQIYYMMGFLLVVLLILAATCAQVSIVMTYLQLCGEDHRWWWKSFGNCASAGLYLFLYSLWFLYGRLELVGILAPIIYLTYMAMISILFGIFCGSVGFLCAFSFNKLIYGQLKVD